MNHHRFTRRTLLKGTLAVAGLKLTSALPTFAAASPKLHVAVIGAGAFGGWTALYLLRSGARVTLIDAWGPGNSRASSGGETRVIRGVYGARAIYTKMAARALKLWPQNEDRWNRKLYTRTGVLWMIVTTNDEFETAALPLLREQNLSYEKLNTQAAFKRFPQINFEGVRWVLLENEGGYLLARQACRTVMENVVAEGGAYKQVSAQPGEIIGGSMSQLKISDGSTIKADLYIFACGPWLPKLFPDILGKLITPTRQEVFYFGTPAGDNRFNEDRLPVWANHGEALFYGIPGNEWRGLKVADDTHGPVFDPTAGERTLSEQNLVAARKMLEYRFPAMKGAPLLESRVCQYENSPDSHFIIDRHPAAENILLLGGGSGHGFKFGPALGEYVSRVVMANEQPDPLFQLKRFENA